jgi:hypothetical protein
LTQNCHYLQCFRAKARRRAVTDLIGGSFALATSFSLMTGRDKTLLKQAEAVEIRSSRD